MRAYRFDANTSLDDLKLHDVPMPKPQRGELLLRIHAVSLNYRDIAMQLGSYPAPVIAGLIPTSDAAAEIIEVGEGVESWKAGDRVLNIFHSRWFGGPMPAGTMTTSYGSGRDGWLTEYKVVSQEAVVRLPDVMSYEEAATLPCAAVTAWTALTRNGRLGPGDTVLTLGTGGVSIFAVQLAKTLGARVIATTSSARKAEALRKLGADKIVIYSDVKEWGDHVRGLTGGSGVDRVVEVGGPGTIGQSLKAVARDGSVALVGFLDANDPGIDYFALFGCGAAVQSVYVGSRSDTQDLVRAWSASGLQPVIDEVFAFDDAKAAFERLRDGLHIGKIVVRSGT